MLIRRRRPGHPSWFVRELLCFAVLVVVLWWLGSRYGESALAAFLAHRRSDLYASLLGLEVTLLGFTVAVLAIVLGYSQAPRFEIVRRSRHWKGLFGSYTRAMRWTACAALGALAALLLDREDAPNLPATVACFVSLFFSVIFVVRMLWVTERVVAVVIAARPRAPGE